MNELIPETETVKAYAKTDKPHHTCNNVACSYFVRTGWVADEPVPRGGCGHYSGEPCEAKKNSKFNPSKPIKSLDTSA